jgi:hypothetical protein
VGGECADGAVAWNGWQVASSERGRNFIGAEALGGGSPELELGPSSCGV